MNEATGFCNGECPNGGGVPTVPSKEEKIKIAKEKIVKFLQDEAEGNEIKNHTWWFSYPDQNQTNSTYMLPFIPGLWNLDNMSLSLNATHPSNNETEYNLHSLFGLSETKITYEILTNQSVTPLKDKRIFILSRSTFSGSGQYTSHWLGDNHRTWNDMKYSISGVMDFNMFGIPLVGPDTCGFIGEGGQEELCGRWVQLATFFPFARQHRDKSGGGGKNEIWRMQEPYKTWAKNALFERLQYVRQMYTCMYEASINGGTCFDPLFFHYPLDGIHNDEVHEDIETTFIAANTYKVSPIIQEG